MMPLAGARRVTTMTFLDVLDLQERALIEADLQPVRFRLAGRAVERVAARRGCRVPAVHGPPRRVIPAGLRPGRPGGEQQKRRQGMEERGALPRPASGAPLPPEQQATVDRLLEPARVALGEDAQAAWAAGQAMTLEQALESALSGLDRAR